jgi:hypothetical protein
VSQLDFSPGTILNQEWLSASRGGGGCNDDRLQRDTRENQVVSWLGRLRISLSIGENQVNSERQAKWLEYL